MSVIFMTIGNNGFEYTNGELYLTPKKLFFDIVFKDSLG
jgi:hypothetical protein